MNRKSAVSLRCMVIVIAAAVLGMAQSEAQESGDVTARLGNVERLLTESSAAKKVEQSGDPQAMQLKAEAEAHFDRATTLLQDGESAAAEAELNEAVRLMTEAARAVHGATSVTQKQSDDYRERRDSVEALAEAHDRIAAEKGADDANRELQDKVAADLTVSDHLLAEGRGQEARAMLDATYEAVKRSLEQLRGGDTLVRELSFETREDEYHYELDRNDTHQMLVKVLFAEKMESSPMRATAETFISKAAALREEAEVAAGKQQFEEAIELLEESTKELIRAIRSAGVYIPG